MSCTKCGEEKNEYNQKYETCFSCYRKEPNCYKCNHKGKKCDERFCNDCLDRTHLCSNCEKDYVYCHYHEKIMGNIYCDYCEKYTCYTCSRECYNCYERYCDICINCRLVKTDCCGKWACDKRSCGPSVKDRYVLVNYVKIVNFVQLVRKLNVMDVLKDILKTNHYDSTLSLITMT